MRLEEVWIWIDRGGSIMGVYADDRVAAEDMRRYGATTQTGHYLSQHNLDYAPVVPGPKLDWD
jgi:hypothetical protein